MGKKANAFGWILCISAALALAGMIVYLVNTTTGYIAGAPVNVMILLLPALVIACAVFLFLRPDALPDRVTGVATFVLAVLMAAATVLFVTERVDVIGDMLNPVNHPDSQVTAVTWAIVGIVLYFLSFLGTAVTTLSDTLVKKR